MDFSQGNALTPLTKIARYAFNKAQGDLHEYWLPTSHAHDPSAGHILRGLSGYFTARGLQPEGWSGLPTSSLMMTGGGTTEAYELIIRALAEDVAQENKKRDEKIQPVILMPTPTYGFFMRNPPRYHIEIATIPRNMEKGGVLERDALLDTVRTLHKAGKRIVAYYDSNPHNPLGLVRGEAETNALYEIFSALNHHYREQDRAVADAKRKESDRFFISYWSGIASRVRMIDDMAYDGLVYEGGEAPFPFARARDTDGKSGFDDSFSLYSLSKAGLANMRAGLVVGPEELLRPLRDLQLETGYSPPKTAMHALYAFYNDKAPFKKWRENHLRQMNEDHRLRGLLLKSLINGWDHMTEIGDADKSALLDIMAESGVDKARAAKWLQAGLGMDIRIVTSPQAGFFHMLDCNALCGRLYRQADGYERRIGDGRAIDRFLSGANMQFCGAGWMGMAQDQAFYRMTFAKSFPEIIEGAQRLRTILDQLLPATNTAKKRAAKRPESLLL